MDGTNRFQASSSVTTVVVTGAVLLLVTALIEQSTRFGTTLWVLNGVPIAFVASFAGRRWAYGLLLLYAALALGLLLGTAGVLETQVLLELTLRLGLLAGVPPLATLNRIRPPPDPGLTVVDTTAGLAGRREFFGRVASEIDRITRYQRPFTVAYLSIEDLRRLEHRHGPATTVEAMRRIAHQISGSLRAADLVTQVREREFAILLPETDVPAAHAVLERLARSLRVTLTDEPVPLSFAAGVTTCLRAPESANTLHQSTYQLMYSARQSASRLAFQTLDDTADSGASAGRGHIRIEP